MKPSQRLAPEIQSASLATAAGSITLTLKMSGYGRDMGHANLESYLETRTLWTNLSH